MSEIRRQNNYAQCRMPGFRLLPSELWFSFLVLPIDFYFAVVSLLATLYSLLSYRNISGSPEINTGETPYCPQP